MARFYFLRFRRKTAQRVNTSMDTVSILFLRLLGWCIPTVCCFSFSFRVRGIICFLWRGEVGIALFVAGADVWCLNVNAVHTSLVLNSIFWQTPSLWFLASCQGSRSWNDWVLASPQSTRSWNDWVLASPQSAESWNDWVLASTEPKGQTKRKHVFCVQYYVIAILIKLQRSSEYHY